MTRASRISAACVRQVTLDDAVLERVEGHDDEAATRLEAALRRGKRIHELTKLVIHINAQRLENARRGVLVVAFGPTERALHEIRELARGGDLSICARPADGT